MLRIDFWNIAFIIINLLVLYFFMKHFLIGPVTKIVEERRQMVEKDLDDVARAKEEAGRMKSLRISSHWYMKTVSHNGK